MADQGADFDELLAAWAEGEESALEKLTELAYSDLYRMAVAQSARTPEQTRPEPEELVNQLFIVLSEKPIGFENRAAFFSFASRLMRHLLINDMRASRSSMRGGTIDLDLALGPNQQALDSSFTEEILSLGQALDRLSMLDQQLARVVELRFFGGMSESEVGDILGISIHTVSQDWRLAKAWLGRALPSAPAPSGGQQPSLQHGIAAEDTRFEVEESRSSEISHTLGELKKGISAASRQLMDLEAKLDAALGES